MKTHSLFITLLFTSFLFFSCNQTEKAAKSTSTTNDEKEASAHHVSNNKKEIIAYKIGDRANDFKLKDVDGKMKSLSDFKNAKGFIVTFTCNHCPYSVLYEDRLIALHNKMEPKGYPVIAINPNDPTVVPEDGYDEMKVRAKEKNFPFVYLFDEGQKVYPQFGATRTPHVFLLDKSLRVRYIGAIDDSAKDAEAVTTNYVEKAIEALEKREDPNPATTKAIGCSIKTKKT